MENIQSDYHDHELKTPHKTRTHIQAFTNHASDCFLREIQKKNDDDDRKIMSKNLHIVYRQRDEKIFVLLSCDKFNAEINTACVQ